MLLELHTQTFPAASKQLYPHAQEKGYILNNAMKLNAATVGFQKSSFYLMLCSLICQGLGSG